MPRHRATENPDLFLLYEHYVDQAALEAHRNTPHFKEIIEGSIVPLLDKREREFISRSSRNRDNTKARFVHSTVARWVAGPNRCARRRTVLRWA